MFEPMNHAQATAQSPLVPTAYDIVWTLVMVAVVAMLIAGLWFLLRDKYPPLTTLLWMLAMLTFPVIGPAVFLLYRSRNS